MIPLPSRTQGICQTAIKKVCRRLGIKKWPYKEMRVPSQVPSPSRKVTTQSALHDHHRPLFHHHHRSCLFLVRGPADGDGSGLHLSEGVERFPGPGQQAPDFMLCRARDAHALCRIAACRGTSLIRNTHPHRTTIGP